MSLTDLLSGRKRWPDQKLADFGLVELEWELREKLDEIIAFALNLEVHWKHVSVPRRSHSSQRLRRSARILRELGYQVVIGFTEALQFHLTEYFWLAEGMEKVRWVVIGQEPIFESNHTDSWRFVYFALALNCSNSVVEALSWPLRYFRQIVLIDNYRGPDTGLVVNLVERYRVFISQTAGHELFGRYSLHNEILL
jgi:hypothetical protein